MMNVCMKLHHIKSLSLSEMMLNLVDVINPTALRKVKIVYNFILSECNRVELCSTKPGSRSKSANDTGVQCQDIDFVIVLLFYIHGKHLRSCRDGQLT